MKWETVSTEYCRFTYEGGKGATINGKFIYIIKNSSIFSRCGAGITIHRETISVFTFHSEKLHFYRGTQFHDENIMVITFHKFHEGSDISITVLRKINFNSSRFVLLRLTTNDGGKKDFSRFTRKLLDKSRITIIPPPLQPLARSLDCRSRKSLAGTPYWRKQPRRPWLFLDYNCNNGTFRYIGQVINAGRLETVA